MRLVALVAVFACSLGAAGRTILAIGAHAGDMELTAGAVLARHARLKDRVVLLHLTLGEGGHPGMPAAQYAAQKRTEALTAARTLGAEAIFGPYSDGRIPRSEEAAKYVAGIIREVKPTYVITHARNSIHKDHSATHTIVNDAVLLASLEGHRGTRGIYYAENWEDAEGFEPYVFIDVSEDEATWLKAVRQYEFTHAAFSGFAYIDYYEGLMKVRGAQARKHAAEAFDIDPLGKKRVLEELP